MEVGDLALFLKTDGKEDAAWFGTAWLVLKVEEDLPTNIGSGWRCYCMVMHPRFGNIVHSWFDEEEFIGLTIQRLSSDASSDQNSG